MIAGLRTVASPLQSPQIPQAKSRRGAFTAVLISLSAFGPYLYSGFRTEQAAVYVVTGLLLFGASWLRARPSGVGVAVLVLLGFQLLLALVGALDPPQNTTKYVLGPAIAGIDNLALPIAVIGTVWMLTGRGADQAAMLRGVCRVAVWAMVVNAGLAVSATGGSAPDLAMFQGQANVETVAYRAEQLGRLSGIFNQPAEAGLMYSVALLCAVYLYRQRPVVLALTTTAISVGGVLTVSKIFLFIGLPVGIWQVLRASGGRQRRFAAVLAVLIALWAAAKANLTPEWTGGIYLLRLMPGGGQDSAELYTAGRLGGESTLSIVSDAVFGSAPGFGFGAGGLSVAYDNAWVEALVMGGLIGALTLTAVIGLLVHAWWANRSDKTRLAESRLAGGLVAVVICAAVGVPSLTANRCATVVWLLMALLLLSRNPSERAKQPGGAATDGRRFCRR